ncbi:MAG TPA: hypothetical protein VLD67_02440 [Vicinamibacterales bacterium]|nr:hypothetical protein [Vicinamibacterales bacterium]
MKKATWGAGVVAAGVALLASPASAQTVLTTAPLNVSVTVGNQARITLTGSVDFADADPDVFPTLTATPLDVQARARVAPATTVNLTVMGGASHFDPATNTIPVANLTWTSTGTGFTANGTMSDAAQQSVGSWTGPGAHSGTQTYSLVNSWAYAPGSHGMTLTYTLSTP